MKRLIRKAYDENYDDFLGRKIEIVYPKSKYVGFKGFVDDRLRSGEKYRVFLEPQNYEANQDYHVIYVNKQDAYKWFKVIDD